VKGARFVHDDIDLRGGGWGDATRGGANDDWPGVTVKAHRGQSGGGNSTLAWGFGIRYPRTLSGRGVFDKFGTED